jgi:hypothetical protein
MGLAKGQVNGGDSKWMVMLKTTLYAFVIITLELRFEVRFNRISAFGTKR